MFSSNQINLILKKAMENLGIEDEKTKKKKNNKKGKKNNKPNLSTSQILIITALIGGVLEVDSFLVGKDQRIEVVLTGSLKEKTELEKIMDQVGTMPFDEVMKTLLDRY